MSKSITLFTGSSKRAVLVALVMWGTVAGCRPQADPQAEQVVNIYSARHYDADAVIYQQFTEETGIKVNLVEGSDDELVERLKTEGDTSPADLFFTVDAARLWRAETQDLFQAVESDTLKGSIPENLRHPDGLWFGLTQRARIIVFNKEKVQPNEIQTYEDLAKPEWKGRVCIRSSNNVYNQSLLASMIESRGAEPTEAWATALVQNFARPPQGGDTDQIKAVAVGECDVAIANHYYYLRLQSSDEPNNQALAEKVGVIFPNQGDRGTHVNISGVGVTRYAPNREAAVKLAEFLVTPAAQTVFAQNNNEFPAVTSMQTPDLLKQFGDFKVDTVNVSAYGRNSPEAVKIADRAGWR